MILAQQFTAGEKSLKNVQSVKRTAERYRTASGSERDKDSTSKVVYFQEPVR
jgi:hypothetical protein